MYKSKKYKSNRDKILTEVVIMVTQITWYTKGL